ncbi:MAG: ABC transporter ATP-binding protein [Lentimicrobiaceae bacterium]|nr:ABC transporter ATP-binding protein [Lentimicrobiaceae bacterium]
MKSLLKINNLRIDFCRDEKWQEVVHSIDFEVYSGRTLGVVGESGSGKSVSNLAIMQLLDKKKSRIKADSILLDDNDISKFSDDDMTEIRGKEIAMIFQEPMTSLNPVYKCGFQVMEAVSLSQRVNETTSLQVETQRHKVAESQSQCQSQSQRQISTAKEKVLELFRKVMLPNPEIIFDKYPHELSGGQKQRVMIAMALVSNPKVLIADEPTTALDVTVQKEILKLLKDLQRENGMGMIFITHDLGVIAEIADDVIVMNKGVIVERGKVNDILNNPQHPYTKGLIACRPPLDYRLERLPIVKEFLDGIWNDNNQIKNELLITDEERRKHHEFMYSQEPILKVQNLKTWYPLRKGVFGRTHSYIKSVDDVSFDVYPGETLGLVGESGCGKTTLGRSILRLVEPTSGNVIFEGSDVTQFNNKEVREYRRQAQIIFQDPYSSLNPRICIGEAIAEPMMIHEIEKDAKRRRERVCYLLEEVGLEASHYQRYPHEFSGGQRQRICIARALAVNPKLIICDESVSALDVSVQAQVLNLLNRLKKDFHFTYIFISHDLSVVRFMSDRVVVMYNGKIQEINEADELFNNPQNDYTKRLIAALPDANL